MIVIAVSARSDAGETVGVVSKTGAENTVVARAASCEHESGYSWVRNRGREHVSQVRSGAW